MKRNQMIMALSVGLLLVNAASLWAGNLIFRYRDARGVVHNITSMDDVRRLVTARDGRGRAYITDYKGYSIMKKYLEDVKGIKDRANDMSFDTTITISADLNHKDAAGNDETGSWSSGDGKNIQIQTWDSFRAVSTLAHEIGHSYMRDKCGKNPTQCMSQRDKYGKDGQHYVNEITHPRTALSEGYAEYHGDREGGGQESTGCPGTGGLKGMMTEGPTDPVTRRFNYVSTDWNKVNNPDNMWACEGINAAMLKDFAKNIPNGAAKIEELMCSSNTLQGVIAAWADKYPGDADALAKIVDAYTNYTMDKEKLRAMLRGKADNYIDKQRDDFKAKYKDKNPCDTTKKIFAKPPAGGGLPPAVGAGGAGGAGGTGQPWRGIKKY